MGAKRRRRLERGVLLIPSLLTTANLFAGFYSVVATLNGRIAHAALAILVAILCDALDGKVARFARASSDFGVEYDSLADLVSFGVAPALLLYHWGLQPYGRVGWLAAFLFVACGALRLARFNVRARAGTGGTDFLGLPIPAAAGLVGSGAWLAQGAELPFALSPLALTVGAYLLAFLMVSNLRYRSFKQLQLGRRKPFRLLVSAVLLLLLVAAIPQVAAFLVFSLYVCSGPVEFALRRWRRAAHPEPGPAEEEEGEDRAESPLP